jgi:hypothetical protein
VVLLLVRGVVVDDGSAVGAGAGAMGAVTSRSRR